MNNMNIARRYDVKWIFCTLGTEASEVIFDTQMEAMTAMAKLETAKAIVAAVKTLTTVNDGAGDLVQEYWDPPCNGIFTDDDVAALGITAAQLTACITTLEQAALFMAGSATTPVVHRVTLNAVRRVTV